MEVGKWKRGQKATADINATKLERRGVCPVCRVPTEDHNRCQACGGRVGPGHSNIALVPIRTDIGTKHVCESCEKAWGLVQKVVAANPDEKRLWKIDQDKPLTWANWVRKLEY